MKILMAASDRDLLACYQAILGQEFGETVTAFDGTRVLALLAEEGFDLAVLDRQLPRIEHGRILRLLNDRGIPAVVLSDSPVKPREAAENPLAVYLSYPFLPKTLIALIRDALAKHTDERKDEGA